MNKTNDCCVMSCVVNDTQNSCTILGQDDPVAGKKPHKYFRVCTLMEIITPYSLNFDNLTRVIDQYVFATNNGEFHCAKCHKTIKVVDSKNKTACQKGKYYKSRRVPS